MNLLDEHEIPYLEQVAETLQKIFLIECLKTFPKLRRFGLMVIRKGWLIEGIQEPPPASVAIPVYSYLIFRTCTLPVLRLTRM